MIFSRFKCKNCKKIILPWHSSASIKLELKTGKTKTLYLCIDCGEKIIEEQIRNNNMI